MKKLFEQTSILNMNLKNRFFRGALWEMLADEKGHMTPELFNVYEELAKGGVGTILTGYAYVTENEQPNPNMMGIYDDSFIEEYKQLTDMVHAHGSNIIMQIVYGGSQTSLNPPSPVIWGPSAVKNEFSAITPKEMTQDDLNQLVQAFADAALRVKKAGFDGVEFHGAHGYLLSQFLSPYFNRRTDSYGGSIKNRARIIFEVYAAVRKTVGEDFPILIKLNSADYAEEGLTTDESLFVARELARLGINAIEVSGGNESFPSVINNNLGPARRKVALSKDNESYFKDYATELASSVDIPVILIGGNRHLDVMENLLNNHQISYFSLARPLTAEPDLINKWITNTTTTSKCVSCNACYRTPGKRCILNINKK